MTFKLDLPSNGRVRGVPKSIWIKEWTIRDINDMSQASDEALDDVLFTVINRGIDRSQPGMNEFNPLMLPMQDRLFILLQMKINVVGPMYTIKYTHRVPEASGEYDKDGAPIIKETCGHDLVLNLDLTKEIKINDIPEKYHRNVGIKIPCGEVVRIRIATYDYYVESRKWFKDNFGKDPVDLPSGDPDYVLFMIATYLAGYDSVPFRSFEEAWRYLISKGARDVSALADTYTYFSDWGPKLEVEGVCPNCERRYSFRLPFFESFFFDSEQFNFDIESAIEDVQNNGSQPQGVRGNDISGIPSGIQ